MKTSTKKTSLFSLFKEAVLGSEQDFTKGSINKAIFLLSVPMILEMAMESVFAVVDIYFVGKLHSNEAVAAVGTTELILTIIYSVAMGLSMGATAMVARRVGEKDTEGATVAATQALYLGLASIAVFTLVGVFYYEELLRLLGASEEVIAVGSGYTQIMMGGNIVIVLLFLINGIFRGAGNASIAMRSLILANMTNIVLDPLFIFGWAFIPALGVKGAAVATTIGRGVGVLYQLYYLFNRKGIVKIDIHRLTLRWDIIGRLSRISAGSTGQFLISSASWIVLGSILNTFGSATFAGYTFAIRVVVFTILPSFGMANAAATLVGQNLGAGQPDRAEKSVWQAGLFNMIFLGVVMVVFLTLSHHIIRIFTDDTAVIEYGANALQIIAIGYIFYGYGMVVTQSFNGAGDTLTPTLLNLFGFWCFQIPMAYLLAKKTDLGSTGVYVAISIAESCIAIAGIIIFRKGKWKTVKV
ncbi:MAG: MATE family efflux transporter [Azospira oryzae]|nr:MAG: MATE family efflux transporter [Azospira oryzae]